MIEAISKSAEGFPLVVWKEKLAQGSMANRILGWTMLISAFVGAVGGLVIDPRTPFMSFIFGGLVTCGPLRD